MPSWDDVLTELKTKESPLDEVRRKYLLRLHQHTGRNVICYYSGWLQKPNSNKAIITDSDKNGFMNAIYQLDRNKGLDLLLHTPGGGVEATESLVHYLRQMFKCNIRVIVPQIAMSAGTMIACSAKEIIMGKQSNLGPIDPQIGGMPTHGVLLEFNRAIQEIKADPHSLPIWQTIIQKYHPTFLNTCQNAIDMSTEVVTDWLTNCMFSESPDAENMAKNAVAKLNNHTDTKSHSRHIHIDEAKSIGLKIIDLEDDETLQDLVLTVHHAYMHTMAGSSVIKMIENHNGKAIVEHISLSPP